MSEQQQSIEVTFSSIWNFHWGQCKVEFLEGSIQVCSEAHEILYYNIKVTTYCPGLRALRNQMNCSPPHLPGGSDSKETVCNAGDPGSISAVVRSPGEGHGNPLHYSCLENSMDRGAWQATVHGVAKSQTQLSD